MCADSDQLAVTFFHALHRKLNEFTVEGEGFELPLAPMFAGDWSCRKGVTGTKGASGTFAMDPIYLHTVLAHQDDPEAFTHRAEFVSNKNDLAIFKELLKLEFVENGLVQPAGRYVSWMNSEYFASLFAWPRISGSAVVSGTIFPTVGGPQKSGNAKTAFP